MRNLSCSASTLAPPLGRNRPALPLYRQYRQYRQYTRCHGSTHAAQPYCNSSAPQWTEQPTVPGRFLPLPTLTREASQPKALGIVMEYCTVRVLYRPILLLVRVVVSFLLPSYILASRRLCLPLLSCACCIPTYQPHALCYCCCCCLVTLATLVTLVCGCASCITSISALHLLFSLSSCSPSPPPPSLPLSLYVRSCSVFAMDDRISITLCGDGGCGTYQPSPLDPPMHPQY